MVGKPSKGLADSWPGYAQSLRRRSFGGQQRFAQVRVHVYEALEYVCQLVVQRYGAVVIEQAVSEQALKGTVFGAQRARCG
jgi:hypothetical protein